MVFTSTSGGPTSLAIRSMSRVAATGWDFEGWEHRRAAEKDPAG